MNQNDIREALKHFKSLQKRYTTQHNGKHCKYVETVIHTLEKQLLKPPEHKVHEKYKALGKNYYCSCGVMFVDFERNGTNFCGNCGQALKEDCNG